MLRTLTVMENMLISSYQPNNRTSITCFGCGKAGHLKKNCTVKRNNTSQTQDKRGNVNQITLESIDSPRTTTGTIGVNKPASEAGVFIRAKVNGVNADMLIDIGATVTLISNDLFKKMENPLITTMNREIL
jgi:predicted aspartyl protease